MGSLGLKRGGTILCPRGVGKAQMAKPGEMAESPSGSGSRKDTKSQEWCMQGGWGWRGCEGLPLAGQALQGAWGLGGQLGQDLPPCWQCSYSLRCF